MVGTMFIFVASFFFGRVVGRSIVGVSSVVEAMALASTVDTRYGV